MRNPDNGPKNFKLRGLTTRQLRQLAERRHKPEVSAQYRAEMARREKFRRGPWGGHTGPGSEA